MVLGFLGGMIAGLMMYGSGIFDPQSVDVKKREKH